MRKFLVTVCIGFLLPTCSLQAQKKLIPAPKDSLSRQEAIDDNGSVDVITEDRMNKGLVTNSLSALSGQSAGVNIATGENRIAQLSSVRVRGTTSLTGGNDPLVIIDGVYSDLSTLSTIYPADIASFTILKNAAETSKYGSRGASGVIQVTTKKGSGEQFHISYDGNIGFESKYKTIDMLDRNGYINTATARGLFYNDGGYNTDFQDVVTRTGYVQNHHIAFSGGGEKSSYRASVGVMDHKTVVRVNSYRNFVAKFDLNQKAFDDNLTVDFGTFAEKRVPLRRMEALLQRLHAEPDLPGGARRRGQLEQEHHRLAD